MYPITALYTGFSESHYSQVEWFLNNDLLGEFTIRPNQDWVNIGPSVFAYFKEQHLDEFCEQSTSTPNGVYLDNFFAQHIGITKLEEGMTIAFDIYVPTAYTKITSQVYTTSDANETPTSIEGISHILEYKMRLTLPISGILKLGYNNMGIITDDILIPYEIAQDCFEEAISQYELKPGEYELQPSAYKLFLESSDDREETISLLETLSNKLDVYDAYEDQLAHSESVKGILTYFNLTYITIYTVTLIMLVIYSVFHKKDVLDDEYFLFTKGLNHRDMKQITFIEFVFIGLSIWLISLPILLYFMEHGIGDYILINQKISSVNYSFAIFKAFIFAIIESFACNSSLFLTRKR